MKRVDNLISRLFDARMATKYDFPKVAEYESVTQYFRDFVDRNKNHPQFTFRNFGEQVGWPHSYLGDLSAGRKPLTVTRVLEFAKFAGMTNPETERLLLMSFLGSANTAVSDFFTEKLNETCELHLKINAAEPAPELAMDPLSEMICSLLLWSRLPMSFGKLKQLMAFLPGAFTDDDIEDVLERLIVSGELVVKDSLIVEIQRHEVGFVTPTNLRFLPQVMQTILSEIPKRNPATPRPLSSKGIYRCGTVEFPIERMTELHQKIGCLANWIGHVNKEAREAADYDPAKNPLIRYDFCQLSLVPGEAWAELFQLEAKPDPTVENALALQGSADGTYRACQKYGNDFLRPFDK